MINVTWAVLRSCVNSSGCLSHIWYIFGKRLRVDGTQISTMTHNSISKRLRAFIRGTEMEKGHTHTIVIYCAINNNSNETRTLLRLQKKSISMIWWIRTLIFQLFFQDVCRSSSSIQVQQLTKCLSSKNNQLRVCGGTISTKSSLFIFSAASSRLLTLFEIYIWEKHVSNDSFSPSTSP